MASGIGHLAQVTAEGSIPGVKTLTRNVARLPEAQEIHRQYRLHKARERQLAPLGKDYNDQPAARVVGAQAGKTVFGGPWDGAATRWCRRSGWRRLSRRGWAPCQSLSWWRVG